MTGRPGDFWFGSDAPGAWADEALCAQTDPEEFFPEKGGSTRSAKAICARCPVSAECLTYALDNHERFGIWGGMSERERRALIGAQDDDTTDYDEGDPAA
ncbi:WhiB family transcriptional regulator [Georgenia sp. MJ206]